MPGLCPGHGRKERMKGYVHVLVREGAEPMEFVSQRDATQYADRLFPGIIWETTEKLATGHPVDMNGEPLCHVVREERRG